MEHFDVLNYKETLKPAPDNLIEQFKGVLPDFLLQEWQERGFASYLDGLLITTDPNDFYDVLEGWVDDPQNCHVVMRTAFGSFYYRHGENYYNRNIFHDLSSNLRKDLRLLIKFGLADKKTQNDALQKAIYTKAAKRLGPPAYDEVFAFVPAIALGGDYNPDNIKKVKLKEHLAFLVQLY